jgi:hypothetical protein
MASPVAAMSGVVTVLQPAGSTTGNGNIIALPPSFRNHTILVKGSAGVGAGAVQVEVSNDPADAGTWAAVTATPTTVVASTDVAVILTGIFNFLRARISTNVTGGTVAVDYEGAKSY